MGKVSFPPGTGQFIGKEGEEVFSIPKSPTERAYWLLYRLRCLCQRSEVELNRIRALRIRYCCQLFSRKAPRWLN